tara:strand:- start:818 stop:988 length:171 start_codon:yes stop_codon:yes gene_type:complete
VAISSTLKFIFNLVRGVDRFEHCNVQTRPTLDLDVAPMTEYDRITALRRGVIMKEG